MCGYLQNIASLGISMRTHCNIVSEALLSILPMLSTSFFPIHSSQHPEILSAWLINWFVCQLNLKRLLIKSNNKVTAGYKRLYISRREGSLRQARWEMYWWYTHLSRNWLFVVFRLENLQTDCSLTPALRKGNVSTIQAKESSGCTWYLLD